MKLHVDNVVVRDNIVNMGETLNLFDEVSIYKAFDPPISLTVDGQIHSMERVLLSTIEEVEIPEGYVGLIMLRSTWARAGLIAPTTYADPGFHGSLTMEVFNSNKWVIQLLPGTHLWECVLVPAPFEPMYTGRYQGQGKGVTLPKPLDFEKDIYHEEND